MTQSSGSSNPNNLPKDSSQKAGLPGAQISPNNMVSQYGGWDGIDSDSDGILDEYDPKQNKTPRVFGIDEDSDGILDVIEMGTSGSIDGTQLHSKEKKED
ncbi:MAG: hypothetical protein AAGD25_24465 [Cyanobacteria bacterium P01_F01_bin.150]